MTKILIIDDEEIIRRRLENLLVLDNYEVYKAANGIEGLDLFNKINQDIVITDIKMPGMGGIEVLKKIKQKSEMAEVIIISGHGDEDIAIRSLQEGAYYYLRKPIDYDELKHQINKIIERQEMKKKMSEYVKNLENVIDEKNQELILRKRAEQSLQENINQGKEYQEKLLKISYPKIHNMRFYSKYLPYDMVGGDIYNIIKKGNNIIFYLSDLAGHGIPSAIISAFIKALIDNWIIHCNIISPKELILLLKETLKKEEIFNENMLTIFIGSLNIENYKLSYISAGHFLPLIYEKKLNNITEFINLEKTYKPITNIINSDGYKEDNIILKNDTKIFVYSDGLIECIDEKNNLVGLNGLKIFIDKNGLSPASLEKILSPDTKYSMLDDVSYILIEIYDNYKKAYFCDINNSNIIIKDFENEVENRYNDNDFNHKCSHCFSEIVLNGIEHGNNNNPEKSIYVNVRFNIDSVVFFVENEGEGFDWKNKLPTKTPGKENLRNRGIFLVNKFGSSVKFNEKGNRVKVKILK